MTDPRTPDDDLRAESFDGLDLDSLSDGVHPAAGQWATISATATRRRHRRSWALSVAAALLLVAATAGVIASRGGDQATISVASGVVNDGIAEHLIPPAAARDVHVAIQSNGATISYTFGESEFTLGQYSPSPTATVVPATPDELADFGANTGATPVEVPGRGRIWVWCPIESEGSDTVGTVVTSPSSVGASWVQDGIRFRLLRASGGNLTCDEHVRNMAAKAAELVPVDASGWQAFLVEHGAVDLDETTSSTGVTVPASAPSTTTLPDDPPVDRVSAEEQIGAAVAAWSQQTADGSFPNLEDGTTKAAEYAEMFDTAAKQSGAAQSDDRSGNTSTVTSIRFVTPERAAIVMSLTATLPTGTYRFPQDGEAILQDGRWVVTYRTVTTTLRRACIPPGGYDGCPSS